MTSEDEGAVKIAVRERPFIHKNGDQSLPTVVSYHPSLKNIIVVNGRSYPFDYALGPDVSQRELYDDLVKPLVRKTLDGYYCTTLAYGQTGTGKTFTMGLHTEYFSGESVGVVPRALSDVFELRAELENRPVISASFVEIYNEKVYDLLGEDSNEQINVKGFKFGGGKKRIIENAHQGLAVLMQGNKCRHIRPTKMNPESSRSHAIFTIHVLKKTENNQIQNSLLHLVDLAGSEGVRRTGHQGVALTEGVHINQGLLSIGKVLQALANKRKVIPYRDSVLSSVLQDSLKPTSYLTLLACISPFREDLSETVSTLRFAEYATVLKHTPQINCSSFDMQKKNASTPLKNYPQPLRSNNSLSKTPTPLKRSFNNGSISTIKKPSYHRNTFCTPNKIKRVEGQKFNRSDFGLTPREKLKQTVRAGKSNFLPIETADVNVHNDTIDSRSSIISMNVSTSTALDAPFTSNINSYSPIVRRCVMEIENNLEDKIEKMFDYMKELHATNKEEPPVKKPETPKEENGIVLNKVAWASIKKEFQSIVREEILSLTVGGTVDNHEVNMNRDLDCDTSINNLRCQLFSQSSPIFKVPEVPANTITIQVNKTQALMNDTLKLNNVFGEQMDETILFQTNQVHTTAANETVIPARRRSYRLSTKDQNSIPIRKSMRIERRNSTIQTDDELNRTTRMITTNLPKERRESVRRSMRIEQNASIAVPQEVGTKGATKSRKLPIGNKVIADYFNETKNPSKSKQKQPKDVHLIHEKAVLDLLNTGSIRELQILPLIGLKTAYQIITQRTLNGKFKNFTQVSKLPVWRGKAWERFKVANSIA